MVKELQLVACPLVTKSLDEWGIYVGIPCKYKKERSKKLLELEKKYNKQYGE
ncbi:hypothetical protein [Lachnobacterium bovis]|uniref:hypothetical protein n=1 Tax=Lachnobacterium bovis TaxID=140626 RepID=UPI001FA78E2F|nr:hypothetical protein [Lachnobacterium bovis]